MPAFLYILFGASHMYLGPLKKTVYVLPHSHKKKESYFMLKSQSEVQKNKGLQTAHNHTVEPMYWLVW